MLARLFRAALSARLSLHLIGLMLMLPFIIPYHYRPISAFYSEWTAALLGLLALLPLLKRESWQPLEIPHSALIFPGFIAIVLVQWMLGMLYPGYSVAVLYVIYPLWALLLAVLGSHLRSELGWEKIAVTLAWYLLIGGVLNVAYVALQYANRLGVEVTWIEMVRVYGALGQANHLASYLALALASVLYLVMKKRMPAVPGAVLGISFLSVLAFSGSRSSWLYLAALVVLALLLHTMSTRQTGSTTQQLDQSRDLLRATLLLIPLFALVQWAIYYLPADSGVALPTERLMDELSGAQVGGISQRLHFWYESLRLFWQSPWLGIGVGNTRWESFMQLDAHWTREMPGAFNYAHNLLVSVLTETGVAGALLLLAGVWAWLRGFQWRNVTPEGWWLLALLAIIGIHSLLEYPLWYTYFLGPAALLLGVGSEQRKQVRTAAGRVVLLVLLIGGAAVLVNLMQADRILQKWMILGAQEQITEERRGVFFREIDWIAGHSLLAPYAVRVYAFNLVPSVRNLEKKLQINAAALRFWPTSRDAYRHPLLLELAGRHDEAVLFMQRAIQLAPNRFNEEILNVPQSYRERYLGVFREAVGSASENR